MKLLTTYYMLFVTWIKNNKLEFSLLIFILLVGAFFRLYKIDQYMLFLGDEGRDVMVVRRFLQEGDLMFVGPGTSVGNMYLGPIYYYMMAPALFLANYSPVGPAVQIALLGVLTIFFLWFVIKRWFKDKNIALIVTSLYAASPVVIIYSRSSWNPNIMPFFSLLTIYSLWKVWQEKKWKWLIVMSIAFAFVTQSHYLGLFLVPTILIFWFLSLRKSWDDTKARQLAIRYSLFAILIITLLSSPLVIFDAKYNWRNMKALNTFIFTRSGDFSFKVSKFIPRVWEVWEKLNIRLLAGTSEIIGRILAILILIVGVSYLIKRVIAKCKLPATSYLLSSWLVFGIFGLALYKGQIYDHYFGFLFAAPFLVVAMLVKGIQQTIDSKKSRVVFYFLCSILLVASLMNNPLRRSPNRLLERSISVAQKIRQEAGSQKYNFALIGDKNYEPAYQYFLELWKTPVIEIDPQRYQETVAEQLFVVCEYPQDECQPTSNPKAQVANFGWSKIEASWEINGVYLFKLVHNIQSK